MLSIHRSSIRLCDGLSRREFLRIGGLGALGLSLPALLAAREHPLRAAEPVSSAAFGRAKRCILLYMWGGPPHQDTFDPKPDAPVERRGEFWPIATSVPGTFVCDHLPLLAQRADKYTIVRSMSHTNGDHISQCHDMLTGNPYPGSGPIVTAAPTDNPHYGAVLAYLRPPTNGLPAYVQLPCELRSNSGKIIPGQDGGFLGKRYAPFLVDAVPNKEPSQDPNFERFTPSDLQLPEGLSAARLDKRRTLLNAFDERLEQIERTGAVDGFGGLYERAFSMVTSPEVRRVFDLSAVDDATRDRYGRNDFGQGVLVARRLVEAGVPLVTVYWRNGPPRTDIGWDNHINNFPNLKNWQLPPLDWSLSALLDDLAATSLLDETLVVWMGEFGRSPSINDQGGRDHWPQVFSVVLAGGGIRGGEMFGSSDREGAMPLDQPVSPFDLGATIYHCLGIDGERILYDQLGRPRRICHGAPVAGLV